MNTPGGALCGAMLPLIFSILVQNKLVRHQQKHMLLAESALLIIRLAFESLLGGHSSAQLTGNIGVDFPSCPVPRSCRDLATASRNHEDPGQVGSLALASGGGQT